MPAGTRSTLAQTRPYVWNSSGPETRGAPLVLAQRSRRAQGGGALQEPPSESIRPGVKRREADDESAQPEQGERLKAALRRKPTQGTREHKGQRSPGRPISVQLETCGHRARVEAPASGFVPRRAKCHHCRRWRKTLEHTARKPIRPGTRTVVGERTELLEGREYKVIVLETPRRARSFA
jgi:hypothetical protein